MQKVIFLVLILVAVGSLAQQMKCVSESNYFIPDFTANWFRATEYCHYLGMRLAIISSAEEQAKVGAYVQSSEKFNNVSSELWIGGNDLAEQGNFYWHDTGVVLSYKNWNYDQPDNSGNIEHCIEIRYIPPVWLWHWNDRRCDATRYFICENSQRSKGILIL